MFNWDTDTVLLQLKTTGQQAVFVASCMTKTYQNSVFTHIHLKSNCLLFSMHMYSIKKKLEQTSLFCYSRVKLNQQLKYDFNIFIIYKIKTVFNDTHHRFICSNAY